MDPVEAPPPHQIRCDGCSQTTPSYDIVHYGSMEQGYRQLCSRCFNTEVAQLAGLEGFEHAKFEAVGLAAKKYWKRSWKSGKTVAVMAALALAIGIGSTTSIYTVVNAVILKPLPYQTTSAE